MQWYRRVIRITAEHSPNVRLALIQQAKGVEPTGEVLVEGVLTWDEYQKRRATWDEVRQCVGLDAMFWQGADLLLFPPAWLDMAERVAMDVAIRGIRRAGQARGVGVDPGEGVANTCWTAVDEHGVIEQLSIKTPDTSVIPNLTLAFCRKHGVEADRCCIDRGGGGLEHGDRLTAMGFPVRTVGFGEAVALIPKRGLRMVEERIDNMEEKYAYANRRAQMYYDLRQLVDPGVNPKGFGIEAKYRELRRQLAPLPIWEDGEGRRFLPPKHRKSGEKEGEKVTLDKLIGCSPDEADSLVLAVHAMLHKAPRAKAGAVV